MFWIEVVLNLLLLGIGAAVAIGYIAGTAKRQELEWMHRTDLTEGETE